METELDTRLRAIEKKLDDTYTMVRKMRGAQQRAMAAKIAYWLFLIILGFIAVGMIKPYIAQLGEAYGIGGTNGTNAPTDYSELLKTLNE